MSIEELIDRLQKIKEECGNVEIWTEGQIQLVPMSSITVDECPFGEKAGNKIVVLS